VSQGGKVGGAPDESSWRSLGVGITNGSATCGGDEFGFMFAELPDGASPAESQKLMYKTPTNAIVAKIIERNSLMLGCGLF
jgi:hypothetical protein